MKTARPRKSARPAATPELVRLRARLAVAETTLGAIRRGEVDTVLVSGRAGPQVFTLKGAEHAYRVLIEAMNEGALTLTRDKTILYANQSFARMVKCPLEQVTGSSLRRFLSAADRVTLRLRLKRASNTGTTIQVRLEAGDGSQVPVQISIQRLAKNGYKTAPFALVVTDMSEARRTETQLRSLAQRIVQVQETERGRVALELHDHITQLLVAVLFRSQALADTLTARDGAAKKEAVKLREMIGETVAEVERISHDLRPSILDQLGLVDVLRATGRDFAARTGVEVKLAGLAPATRLPADIELALYRIFQETLKNVEQHARARRVTVVLAEHHAFVSLNIKDDGIGFDAGHHAARRKGRGILGLVGMRERAAAMGGTLTVKSGLRAGTEIEVLIPLPPGEAAA
jgi:PAS domain S-box-containing protein